VSRLVLLVVLVAGLAAAPTDAAVGHVRLLVVPPTWGPPVASSEEIQAQVAEAGTFLQRSSFGPQALR
jgi:hypothetical protein